MRYGLIPLWAALQIGFVYLFLSAFLASKCKKADTFWFLVFAVLLTAVYGFFDIDGIYGYLMYLLMAVLMMLYIFGESGGRGICLLAFAFLIPVCIDGMILQLTEFDWAVTLGKLLPLGCAWALRRYRKPASRIREDTESMLLRQHMEMQQESMSALEANFRLQRKSAHEFEHHMQVLRDLLERNEVDAARDYLDRLKKNRSIHVMSVSSNHPVIDVILNQKYQTARENEIKMQIQVNDLSALTIPTDSLVVVLTNLLDNAIEACRRVNGCREIFCSILYEDGLYISIRNTSEPVEIVEGKAPTTKQNSLSHGFGLLSVTYVLDKLGAEYAFGYDEGWFRFAAEMEP